MAVNFAATALAGGGG